MASSRLTSGMKREVVYQAKGRDPFHRAAISLIDMAHKAYFNAVTSSLVFVDVPVS